MRDQSHLVPQAQHHLCEAPELMEDICELHRLGAIPKFRGPSPGGFRVRGLPRNPSEQNFMIAKLWKYVEAGKMFVCTPEPIGKDEEYLCSPSTTVAKKLPDRTISADKRLILDVRRVNLRFPKSDYWAMITPSIDNLAIRFRRLRAGLPGIPILGAKRDIDAAFARCRLHPDSSVMFGAEFQLSSDPADVVIFFYLVPPFGFSGSSGIFGRLVQGVQFPHRSFSPSNTLWGDSTPLRADVFVDDGMFLEAKIGQRTELPTNVWGTGSDLVLGAGSISKKKLLPGGTWGKKLVLLGYMVDLEEDTISLPDPKILGAANLIRSPEFNPGRRTLSLHSVQEHPMVYQSLGENWTRLELAN